MLTKPDVASAIGQSVPDGLKDAGKMGQITFSHCSYKDGSKTLVLATVYTYQMGKAEMQKQFEAAKKQEHVQSAESRRLRARTTESSRTLDTSLPRQQRENRLAGRGLHHVNVEAGFS